ncbi:MAG: hypothetical protein EOO11_05700 [Chitinophagaceae bacterium]|nr:MAG: hypothetical protein EOO11_05700 [Chitinophagaceae bacterium]
MMPTTPALSPEAIMAKVATGKPFTLLLLKAGRAPEEGEDVGSLQMGHLAHLFGMEQEGKALVFGPVTSEGDLKGIIIFNTADKELVHTWMAEDPMLKAGIFRFELHDWFTIPGQGIPA